MNLKHDKEKAVQIGLKLFCSKGYTNVGLDELCKATGMTKGAFYNAFGNKEQFLLETIAFFERSNTARITEVLKPKGGTKAIDRLKFFYIDMLERQPRINFMGCMVNNMMSELGAINAPVASATNKGFETFIDVISPTVNLAQKEGDLDPEFDPTAIATLLHTTFYGALTQSKSLGDPERGIASMQLLFKQLTSNHKQSNLD